MAPAHDQLMVLSLVDPRHAGNYRHGAGRRRGDARRGRSSLDVHLFLLLLLSLCILGDDSDDDRAFLEEVLQLFKVLMGRYQQKYAYINNQINFEYQ